MRRDIDTLASQCIQPPTRFQAWMDDVIAYVDTHLEAVCQHSIREGAPETHMATLASAIRDQTQRWG